MEDTLTDFLHRNIPISSAMGVRVLRAAKESVLIKAPLQNNINHKNTVFGGSLQSVATLACWSLLHLNLDPLYHGRNQIVIANSTIDYLLPVTADFHAECALPDSNAWARFAAALERKGKGRLCLEAKIYCRDVACAKYAGAFAAIILPHRKT